MTFASESSEGLRAPRVNAGQLFAELFGTWALVFIGAGAVIVDSHTGMSHLGREVGKVGLVGIALAHGLVLAGAIQAVGSISGGHFNPAVSLAMWLRGKLDSGALTGYVLAQLAGALAAALCLAAIFPDEVELAALGTPALAPGFTLAKGLVLEALITFVLVLVILFLTRDGADTRFAGVAIGATLAALILFAGPLTGGSANPARFLGPAMVSRNMAEAVVYVVGPLLGGGIAYLAYWFGSGLRDADVDAAGEPEATEGAPAGEVPAASRSHDSRRRADAGVAPEERIRRARQLFRAGRGEEAATVLVPLLACFEDLSAGVAHSARTLLVLIEEEHGHLSALDGYRDVVRQGG